MTYAEYAALPGLRASHIKAGRTSMLHMHDAIEGPEREETPALRLGRLVHAAILEPAVLLPQLAVFDGDKRSKAWREFQEQHTNRIIVDRDEAEAVGAISAAVHADQKAAFLLAWLDRGKLISPASARVGPTDLERLRARGLDLSRRQLAAQRRVERSPNDDVPVLAASAAPGILAEGGH
jgi:hypothetical protein